MSKQSVWPFGQGPLKSTISRFNPGLSISFILERQPLSTFSVCCLLGDMTYSLNGLTGSLHATAMGEIQPSVLLIAGGLFGLAGHLVLLSQADEFDHVAHESGRITELLRFARKMARSVVPGARLWRAVPIGFLVLSLNGLFLGADACFHLDAGTPSMYLELTTGLVLVAGLWLSAIATALPKAPRNKLILKAAATLLVLATLVQLGMGLSALAPFSILGGGFFLVANVAQMYAAARIAGPCALHGHAG